MRKRLFISAVSLLLTGVCYAQWSAQDSLKLQKLLEGSEELKLNPKAVKQIDFGGAVGSPRMSEEKRWMLPDESLPEALPKPKVVLTLMPYKANTRYNWDPVYQKKIRVNKNTWRGDSFYELCRQRFYTNRTRSRKANEIRIGEDVSVCGGTISGLDLMAAFTKEFWNKTGRDNRIRTLEVLKTYGDSTTVLINKPIEQITRENRYINVLIHYLL